MKYKPFIEVENFDDFKNLKLAVDNTNSTYITYDAEIQTYGTPDILWGQIVFVLDQGIIYSKGKFFTNINDLLYKADINSPDFTGIPTAPTAYIGTNTSQIATTAFVHGEIEDKANISSILIPNFDNLTPLKTIEFDVSDNNYYKLFTRSNNDISTTMDEVNDVVMFRITATGTNIYGRTDIVVKFRPGLTMPLHFGNHDTFSITPATSSINTFRLGYPKTLNSGYPWEAAFNCYNSTARHIKIEVFATTENITWITTKTTSTINGTYCSSLDKTLNNIRGLFTSNALYALASNATSADYASYITGYSSKYLQGVIKAGESLSASSIVYINNKLAYKISNKNYFIEPDYGLNNIGNNYSSNSNIIFNYYRSQTQQITFTNDSNLTYDTFSLGDKVYLRCNLVNGKLYSDAHLAKDMTPGYTWYLLGTAYSDTQVCLNTMGSFFITLDNSGRISHINGIPTSDSSLTKYKLEKDYSKEYLTFEALEDGTFEFYIDDGTGEYSLDNGTTWVSIGDGEETPTVLQGNRIMWRAKFNPGGYVCFDSTEQYNVEGNIMSVIFGDNFVGQTDLTGYVEGLSEAFTGTQVVDAGNLILPATTLAESCYKSMFSGCTSLIKAPILSATILVDDCYYNMFQSCTLLNSITCLATDISATNCTSNWVYNVAPTGIFIKAASIDDWNEGDDGIPEGWVVCNEEEYNDLNTPLPLMIEVEEGDTDVPTGTYNKISVALILGKDVIVRYLNEDGFFIYMPVVCGSGPTSTTSYDFSGIDGDYYVVIYIRQDDSCTIEYGYFAYADHTHGNIQENGTLQTSDVIIANGDKLIVTDASDSNKIARTSLSFDGSTTTKALSQKGTWETFLQSHQDISGKANLDSPVFTGTPTAPTAYIGNNTNQIATTEFVNNSLENINPSNLFISPYYQYQISNLNNSYLSITEGDNIEEAIGKLEKAIIDNECVIATSITDINEKISYINFVNNSSLENINPSNLFISSYYQISYLSNSYLSITEGDNIEEAIGKLEKAIIDNEFAISTALIDLNNKITIANWEEDDPISYAYIQNKPDLSNFLTIETQSNWNETNTSSAAYIQNKPTIPDAQIQADWNQITTTALDYIKNKPNIYNNLGLYIRDNSSIEISTTHQSIIFDDAGVESISIIGDEAINLDADKVYYNSYEVATKNDIPTVPTTSTSVTQNDTNPVSGGAVYNKFADLIGTAPVALDTLGEIAYALNNDADLAATLTNQISSKVPKVSNPTTDNFASFNSDGTIKDSSYSASSFITSETQPNWNETNTSSAAYIQNKPIIPTDYVIDYSKQYLTFVALESGTISFNIWKNMGTDMITSISYSTDNGSTWVTTNNVNDKEEHLTISVNVNEGDKILWKGNAQQLGYFDEEYYGDYVGSFFSSDCEFDVQGNVMSMLYSDNFIGEDTLEYEAQFACLFYDYDESNECKVVNARNLSLSATTLVGNCYNSMFKDCTILTTAPQLPATTLESYCYYYMFSGCTSLTTAPELSATTLAQSCYSNMFYCCTVLITAPELPATTLATSCYYEMFRGCTSLAKAPKLPATTLTQLCYQDMFNGCTSLNSITCLATDISAISCITNWVLNVAANGIFVKANGMNSWTTGNSGIPTGWTVYTDEEYEVVRHYELPDEQVQADWEEDDPTSYAYIQNKPIIRNELSYNYEISSYSNSYLSLKAGDTYDTAFGKLEKAITDNSEITAIISNDLNNKLSYISASSLNLSSNYEMSYLSNSYLYISYNDTVESAIGKLEKAITDNNEILATAIVELDYRISYSGNNNSQSNSVVTSFNGQTGDVIYIPQVTSVNGQTGAVTIDTSSDSPIINAIGKTYSSSSVITSSPYTASIWRIDLSDEIDELYSGLTILIKIPVAGNGSYGTLLRIDGTDSSTDSSSNLYPVCANVNSMIGTRYEVGCIIALTFDAEQSGQTLYYNSSSKFTTTDNGTGWTKPGCWKIADYNYDSDKIGYQIRTNSYTLPAKFKTYRYRLLFTSADNLYFVGANDSTSTNATDVRTPTTEKINPFGPIVYYGSTSAINANDSFGANNVWQQYVITLGYSFNNTGSDLTLTTHAPVYVKCAPQSDGSAIIDATTPYVQSLPSTEDGKIYILLGYAYSATNIELIINHPVYYYKDGCIRIWTNPTTSSGGGGGLQVQSDWNESNSSSSAYILNKPIIPTIPNLSYNLTGSGNAVTNISVNSHEITLEKGSTFLTQHQSIKTINGQTITGSGNVNISGLPEVNSSYNGKIMMVINGQWALVSPSIIYTGNGTPSNINGNNGDIYIQT